MPKSKPRRLPLDLSVVDPREALFRLSGAARRSSAVEKWLQDPLALRPLARTWFEKMRRCGNDVRELIHDGCPVACVEDAAFGYVNAFKNHVNVGFFHGAALPDPAGLLEGAGKRMRHVKLRPDEDVDPASLEALIASAYADIKARLRAESDSR